MNRQYDVIVYGATPGGIGAAIAAARRGRRTLLLEPSAYIGGLMTSGLGRTDIHVLGAAGGIYREFAANVYEYYINRYGAGSSQVEACNNGMFFEPSVAKKLLWNLLDGEEGLEVRCQHRLVSASVAASRLTGIRVQSRQDSAYLDLSADVFIDGTYEGDLAALAGVSYSIGRESRDEWNEEYAGKIYIDFHPTNEVFPGSTGEGDDRIQAYNFRLCLTDKADNRAAVRKPAVYMREDYASLVEDIRVGRVNSIRDVLNMLPIPNGKTDSNNHHYCMCSSDLPEENGEYIEGDSDAREAVVTRHRNYLQGLLWFLQNDDELPQAFREDASRWGYAADEFEDTDHFPPQIYVREGRRIHGEYVFSENDARIAPGFGRTPIHFDSVAVGAYSIDSHATRKREPQGRNITLEGFLGLSWISEIYQIPYGIMVPLRIDGLLVPVAVSATHMGFGTIRMEPCWMQLGFAAGVAADVSIALGVTQRKVPVDRLQDELLAHNQMLTYFEDGDVFTDAGKSIQYFGTKGIFFDYEAHPEQPVSVKMASRIIHTARGLPGGRRLPVLPASNTILPTGVDMGPRSPRDELFGKQYWKEHEWLSRTMFSRWLQAVRKHLGVHVEATSRASQVTVGELCAAVYSILRELRSH